MRIPERTAAPDHAALEDVEVDLLLEGIHRLFGYDFRQYARSTVKRRLTEIMVKEHLGDVSELQGKLLRNPELLDAVVAALSIQVSSLFRDSKFYLAFRRKAIPILRTYPSVRIWHAGCANGEEVYSLAILLAEEGLLNKCQVYATDLNVVALETASNGVYPVANITKSEGSYDATGGSRSLRDYFQTVGNEARILPSLKDRITFLEHNLVTDASFNEFHVILCRNVLIYFSKPLQDRVHELLYEILVRLGILGLGATDTLDLTPKTKHYRALEESARLYRRID
jgi:chemotaxis protein methyltransferase CheR